MNKFYEMPSIEVSVFNQEDVVVNLSSSEDYVVELDIEY